MGVNIYLKIQDIPGESSSGNHKGEIEIASWSFGVENPAAGTDESGRSFSFTHKVDKASPKLLIARCTQQAIPEATLSCVKGSDNAPLEYLQYKFTDCTISKIVAQGNDVKVAYEEVSWWWIKVETTYRPTKNDGSLGPAIFGSCSSKV